MTQAILPFPPNATVDFTAIRDDMIVLSVRNGAETGYVGVIFESPQEAKANVAAVFSAGDSLIEVLASVAPLTIMDVDLLTREVFHMAGRKSVCLPCAVMGHLAPGTSIPAHAAPDALREAMAKVGGAKAPTRAAPPIQEPVSVPDKATPTIEPDPVAPAIVVNETTLSEWMDPKGRKNRLFLTGDGETFGIARDGKTRPIMFHVQEVPSLLSALALVPAPSQEARVSPPATPSATPATSRAWRLPTERANRVVLARLYAAYPEGLTLEELEVQATQTGLAPGAATAALGRLGGEGRTAHRDGVYVIAQ